MNQQIKVAISFLTTEGNPILTNTIAGICASMTDNPNYSYLDAGIAKIALENSDYSTAINNAANGGTTLTAEMYTRRATVVGSMRNLALYVQIHCKNSLSILLTSGFKAQKTTRTPSVIPDAPAVQKIGYGANSGTIDMRLVSVGALSYNWRCYLGSAPDVMLNAMQTSAASALFTGLTPGLIYYFQGNAMNQAGISDWSEPYSIIVT